MNKTAIKTKIDVYKHLPEIFSGIKTGCLITTQNDKFVNPMTISWGTLGIEWNKLIFTTFVRTGRHTHKMLEQSGEFTVNIGNDQTAKKILSYCGTKSGKDTDKIKDLGLNLIDGMTIKTPGIKELPLTLECKVIYTQLQDQNAISDVLKAKFYPNEKPSDFHGSNCDYHTMFYGEVVGAYMIEDS